MQLLSHLLYAKHSLTTNKNDNAAVTKYNQLVVSVGSYDVGQVELSILVFTCFIETVWKHRRQTFANESVDLFLFELPMIFEHGH